MTIYEPYTYLIGWTQHNKWYYGVRFSKKCNPNELWKTYFTSSKYVKDFRKKYGPPDIIQIRKVFASADAARIWEHKVLKRLRAKDLDKWINLSDSKAIYNDPIKRVLIGKKISQNLPKAMNEKRKSKTYDEWYRKTRRPGITAAAGLGARTIKTKREKNIDYDSSYRKSRSSGGKARKGFVWVKNENLNLSSQISASELPRFLKMGWNRGRIL